MISASKERPLRKAKRRQPLGRGAWLDTARRALIEEGTVGVEVNKLAKRLGISRGGFYYFFANREQLLDELLTLWVRTSVAPFERILRDHDGQGQREFAAVIRLWIDEKDHDPVWDGAVRAWARVSPKVARAVQLIDQQRIGLLERIFVHLGYAGIEANVRARVTYYHQVGYHTLGVLESEKIRLRLAPIYAMVLTGMQDWR